MTIRIKPLAEVPATTIAELNRRLVEFYRGSDPAYYTEADWNAGRYGSPELSFHRRLLDAVRPGMTVCEVGCGTAHFCPEVERRGGLYTGMDWGESLLAANRRRYPTAQFVSLERDPDAGFDFVVSLYALEHLADPVAGLEQLVRLCRAGGLIGVLCPDFVRAGGAPSLYFGRTPRRFREKIRSGSWIDAIDHLRDMWGALPRWSRLARNSAPGCFWINLEPRILTRGTYLIDADAVHLPHLDDLVFWFRRKGLTVQETTRDVTGLSGATSNPTAYVLARKS